jgi:hypothetical protein
VKNGPNSDIGANRAGRAARVVLADEGALIYLLRW